MKIAADLILLNSEILTMNSSRTIAEALALRGDKILAVGPKDEVTKHAGRRTRIIDLEGRAVLPGLIDCHIHLIECANLAAELDLRNCSSIAELQQRLKEDRQQLKGKWLLGRGWDQEKFLERRLPTKNDLDVVVKNIPVALRRICGHILVANSMALRLSGITKDTKHPPGGSIDRDNRGEPTGIVREVAMTMISSKIPRQRAREIRGKLTKICQQAVSKGLTTVHCILSENYEEEFKAFVSLSREGKLPIRIRLMLPIGALRKFRSLVKMAQDNGAMLEIVGFKIFADGSLGARTAALSKPYSDDLSSSGILLYTNSQLQHLVSKVHRLGYQLAIHAIGDAAIDQVLYAIESATSGNSAASRHRIEHCSVPRPSMISRMKQLGTVASVQPHFVISDFWVADRLSRLRSSFVYPFKTMMKAGLIVIGGSDSPVEPLDPLLGVWAAVVRRNGRNEERLEVNEALRMYTYNAAYSSFEEGSLGKITEGFLADLVVVSRNPLKTPPQALRRIEVNMTIVGGKIVYQNSRAMSSTKV